MKKINRLASVLLASLVFWMIQAALSYHNYTRHVALYAANGWTWYDDTVSWGVYIVPTVIACLVAKFVIHKKSTT